VTLFPAQSDPALHSHESLWTGHSRVVGAAQRRRNLKRLAAVESVSRKSNAQEIWEELPPPSSPVIGDGRPRDLFPIPDPHPAGACFDASVFGPDPDSSTLGYDADVETGIYTGKYVTPTQRPWIEWGRGLYQPGEIPPSATWLGETNLVAPHFLVYGDYRTASSYNQVSGRDKVVWGSRLNLDLDLKITATERVHAFVGPIDRGVRTTHWELDDGDIRFFDEFDHNFDTVFFEGDIGSLYGGWVGVDAPFDLPFAVGLIPLFFQNGVWVEDALWGAIVTIPARHSARLDWSNFDLSFFAAFDEIDSPVFARDDSAATIYGVHAAIDAYDGYLEAGYAFVEDSASGRRSYHNAGFSFTRRYWHRISNSVRLIANSEQDPTTGPQTADGQLVILENAWISSAPNHVVPYLNLFAGFGSPQSIARAGVSGGILRNVGINFETDGVTGYPLLDDSANNTHGGAVGINILGPDFSYQLIVECAWVQTFGRAINRTAAGDQYGAGVRYQFPIHHAWILRFDAMHGFLENDHDVTGARVELRHKF
jgi:hypothetical protein